MAGFTVMNVINSDFVICVTRLSFLRSMVTLRLDLPLLVLVSVLVGCSSYDKDYKHWQSLHVMDVLPDWVDHWAGKDQRAHWG